jgi:hypothetical protein
MAENLHKTWTPRARVAQRAVHAQGALLMDWGFVVFVGTMLFFAGLHQWPPDGRRWQREREDPKRKDD